MLSLNLDDFSVLKYQPGGYVREPEVTVRPDMLLFNTTAMKKLGQPDHLRLLFDAPGKRLAIQGKTKESKETINLHPNRKSKYLGIYDTSLVKAVMTELGMSPEHRYKASGVYYEEENVMLFDLSQASKHEHPQAKR